ncbi:MAG: MBL fold metallo-hydrolase [Chthonomonadales bacterium]
MISRRLVICASLATLASTIEVDVNAASPRALPESITIQTKGGLLVLQPLKHGSVLFKYKSKNYFVDPAQLPADMPLPLADAIFITHEHGDHCDPATLKRIQKLSTVIIANANSAAILKSGIVLKNGDKRQVLDVSVEAVPAYNIERPNFHPKGRDNGYVITAGDKRIYFAGDTENTPEMRALKNIDVAFLPINLPFTMPPKDAAAAARAFQPKMLIPYHQGSSNPTEVQAALKDTKIVVKVIALP